MIKNTLIFILFLFLVDLKAESYYCWALNGLNIRENPSPSGKVVGKVSYGKRIEVDLKLTEFSNYYEDLFLIGQLEDKSADIKFTGFWYYLDNEDGKGYVFSGYLSRYPTFEINRKEDQIICESSDNYLIRNFNLINHSISEFDSLYFDNKRRTYFFEEGIMLVKDNSDKGTAYNIIFSEMTMNEALLFIKFGFNLLKRESVNSWKELEGSDHYFGTLVSDERLEINFPAPSGAIIIIKLGESIIISVYGSC